jgi:hypothetical protein
MIPSKQYRFQVMTRLLVHQSGSPTGIPQNYVPLWIGMLPTEARPSQEHLNKLWEFSHKDFPEDAKAEFRRHFATPLQIDCEDLVQLQRAPGRGFRIDWPRWYVEAVRSGAITTWDDQRISLEVQRLFGVAI